MHPNLDILFDGCFWYITDTRPNIYSMDLLNSEPHVTHWREALWVLKYLYFTMDYGITYLNWDYIYGYSDIDWAQFTDNGKSISGYCFIYGGGLIWLSSTKQSSTYSSSIEV